MKELSLEERNAYYMKEYGPIWPAMLFILENYANIGPNKESNSIYFLHPFGYSEISIECDTWYDVITHSIRRGDLALTCEQAKEYLRFNCLVLMLDQVLYDNRLEDPKCFDDPEKFKKFCLSHPLWARLEKQAQKTLDSLRIKKV